VPISPPELVFSPQFTQRCAQCEFDWKSPRHAPGDPIREHR
jgi:hypothetical protein